MDKIQLLEIEKYLKTKNLSQDIFLEVFDHFVAQVTDLIKSNHMQFQAAFLEVKKKWQNEFVPVKKSIFSLKRVPKIVRSLYLQQEKSVRKNALISALVMVFLQFAVAKLFSAEISVLSNVILSLAAFLLVMILGFSILIFSRKNENNVLGLYFRTSLFSIMIGFGVLMMLRNDLDIVPNIHKFFYNSVNDLAFFNEDFLSVSLVYFTQNTLAAYFVLYLNKYFKIQKRIQWVV